MSQGRQHRPRSRTPPARPPPETAEAAWRRKLHAATTAYVEEVDYLAASAEVSLPADTPASLGAKLAALVGLWQQRAEALHVLVMLEDEERGFGGASPPGPGTRS